MDDHPETTGSTTDVSLSIREPPRVLVPVEVLAGQTIPQSLVTFLAPAELVVLGYHVLPEQTPTEQASMQFEDRARTAVDEIARTFAEAGRDVETRVTFTHDRDKTLDRVAEEVGATAVLLPNPAGEITDVLVPLRGAIEVDRLADLVATLVGENGIQVTLWALASGQKLEDANRLLDDAVDTLRARGIPADQLATEVSESEAPTRAIVNRSDEFDIVVMGEGEQSLLTTVLGDTTERIAEGSVAPVLVVRGRDETTR